MRYRSSKVFCLGGWSPLLPTGFLVSRGTLDSNWLTFPFIYKAFTFCGRLSQVVQLGIVLHYVSPQPQTTEIIWFGLLPCSLAATLGISIDFFSSGYLDVSVPQVPSYLTIGDSTLLLPGSPIRISAGQGLLAAHRSFS